MKQKEKFAYEKGYRIDKNGVVTSMNGRILKLRTNTCGYYVFGVKLYGNKVENVTVHRFQAYTKFGNELYQPNIVVRHLNGNPLDNSYNNIAIGTIQDNVFDIPPEVRAMSAYIASRKRIKYDDDLVKLIRLDHENGVSYKQLMQKYNISSKGTLNNIINKRILDYDEHFEKAKKRKSEKRYCKYCGKLLIKRKTFCSIECRDNYHKSNIPTLDELAKLYDETKSMNKMSVFYNVNDQTISRWFKVHGFTYETIEELQKKIQNYLDNSK